MDESGDKTDPIVAFNVGLLGGQNYGNLGLMSFWMERTCYESKRI